MKIQMKSSDLTPSVRGRIELSELQGPRSIAIVSGKGGSGKTMIAASIMRWLSWRGREVVLVDADTGTGGLTYYLGLKHVQNTAVGLSDLAFRRHEPQWRAQDVSRNSLTGLLQPVQGSPGAHFLGIGDHRLFSEDPDGVGRPSFEQLFEDLKELQSDIIVDCRGGIDKDSLAVCRAVDDILLVVEQDTTSIQATQHVVEVLSRHGIGNRIRGFILNKVFDDPTVTARTGTSVFRSRYLGAVPFDLEATRCFLVGDIPSSKSVFGAHVAAALSKAYGIEDRFDRVWTARDFREVGLSNLDSVRGGLALSALIALCMVVSFSRSNLPGISPDLAYSELGRWVGLGLGFLAGLESFRRLVGRVANAYVRAFSPFVFGRTRSEYE